MEEELVKMSEKGQLVVPHSIRNAENLSPSDRFVALPVKGGVLFKKVKIPSVKNKLNSLMKEIESHFKEKKVEPEDVQEAVKWARQR